MLDLARQYALLREPIRAAIERVCSPQRFILGEEVKALESEIAAFTSTADAVGCASGTDALWLALAAVGVQPGDTVITTAFTFCLSQAPSSGLEPDRCLWTSIPRPSTSIRHRSQITCARGSPTAFDKTPKPPRRKKLFQRCTNVLPQGKN
jgi:hypothetical protein